MRTIPSRVDLRREAQRHVHPGIECYSSEQRFHFCTETFHSRLLSRRAALLTCVGGREGKAICFMLGGFEPVTRLVDEDYRLASISVEKRSVMYIQVCSKVTSLL